jgi:drug/metabolite transporter (DMT)-like permease
VSVAKRLASARSTGADAALRSRLSILSAGVLWSLGGVCIKSLALGAVAITGYRCLFAALAILPLLRRAGWPPARDLAVSVALYAVMLLVYVAAVQGTTAANANLLQYTAPIWVLLLSPAVLRERGQPADRRAIVISLTGVAILFFGNWRGAEARGLILGLISGVFFGLFMLWQRRLRGYDPASIVVANNLGVALLLLPFAGADLWPEPRALGILVFMGAIQFGIPYLLFTRGLKQIGGPEASLLTLIEPVLTPVWVALIVGERPTVATIAGGACILAALAMRYLTGRKDDS